MSTRPRTLPLRCAQGQGHGYEREHVVALIGKHELLEARGRATDKDRELLARLRGRLAELDAPRLPVVDPDQALAHARQAHPRLTWELLDWPGGPYLQATEYQGASARRVYAELGRPAEVLVPLIVAALSRARWRRPAQRLVGQMPNLMEVTS